MNSPFSRHTTAHWVREGERVWCPQPCCVVSFGAGPTKNWNGLPTRSRTTCAQSSAQRAKPRTPSDRPGWLVPLVHSIGLAKAPRRFGGSATPGTAEGLSKRTNSRSSCDTASLAKEPARVQYLGCGYGRKPGSIQHGRFCPHPAAIKDGTGVRGRPR